MFKSLIIIPIILLCTLSIQAQEFGNGLKGIKTIILDIKDQNEYGIPTNEIEKTLKENLKGIKVKVARFNKSILDVDGFLGARIFSLKVPNSDYIAVQAELNFSLPTMTKSGDLIYGSSWFRTVNFVTKTNNYSIDIIQKYKQLSILFTGSYKSENK